MLVEW